MPIIAETVRIKIAKRIDEHGGRWLLRLVDWLRRPRNDEPAKTDRILIIKFWGIGSIILCESALRYLRKKFPRARIDFLTLAQNRELFKLLPHVDQVYAADFSRLGRFLISTVLLILRLRRQYDLIFDAEFFANFSALVATLARPRRVIGFSRPTSIKNRLLDVAVPFDDDQHAAENFLRLVKIGTGDESNPNRDENFPRLILPSSPATPSRFSRRLCVVMNVNASPLALERRWPQERFASLAKWLLQRYQTDLILIGARGEEKYTQAVTQAIAAPGKVHNLAGNLSLSELAEVIRQAALFISNDSGPLHLAAALQKPVVGFYGPETPKLFGPLCKNRLIFYLGLPCSPCMSVDNTKTVNCTNQMRCLIDLKVSMVIPRLQRFIDENEFLPQRKYEQETVAAV